MTAVPTPAAAEPSRGAPPAVVGPYLARVFGDDRWIPCRVELISGGKSNLTYRVSSDAGDVVLRRPPLSSVLPTAHDMTREHTVITALRDTDVPVPRTYDLCDDESVLGAKFYVMDYVDGHIVRDELPPLLADETSRRELSERLVEVLVALHAVDPRGVGLGEFGRPSGYLERQLRRWSAQWEATRVEADGGLDDLVARLRDALPESPETTVVHGDYRLDNALVGRDAPPHVAAVLDWEMSTLGDPLADLGLLLVYWQQADDTDRREALVVPAATTQPGFLTRDEVAQRYAELSGRDVSALPWYSAFGFFKLAVVCAGIAARGKAGAMIGEGFVEAEERVAPLAQLGHAVLDGRTS